MIDNYFQTNSLSFPYVNSFFDFKNFTEPVKHYIDDSLFWELEKDRIKNTNFYVKLNQA
jgi:hypothetical protein